MRNRKEELKKHLSRLESKKTILLECVCEGMPYEKEISQVETQISNTIKKIAACNL